MTDAPKWSDPAGRLILRRRCIQSLLERGLCRQCCRPIGDVDPRHPKHRKGPPKLCRVCLDKAAAVNLARRLARAAAGVCLHCGASRAGVDTATTGSKTACRVCQDRVNARQLAGARARYQRLRAAGLCTHCGKPTGGGKLCREHADRHNARKRLRRAAQGARMPQREVAGGDAARSHMEPAGSPDSKGGGAW